MTDRIACPTCGTPVAAGGLCPRCLLGAGLGEGGPHDAAAPPSPDEIAKEFPGFEILEVLGQGGMGIVYKARQKSLDRLVALKVLPPEIAREPGFSERFAREARTLARLHHEHIVGIHEFGETNGLFYLVMEFVDGPNLRQVIRDGKLEAPQALAIVPQICEALQYAHDQGVVHRDVKPENVLLDRAGRVKIADFGLAKLAQRAPLDLTLTRAGQVMGTLQYMAPEQYRAPDSVDHRADIFSLGVVFYEMLTGDLPVGTFPPPSTRAGVDARLDGVVLRALERERDRRWQKVSEMGSRIDTIASGGAAVPANPPPGGPPAAPHAQPAPVAAPAPGRVSRLAVIGCLCAPLALAIGALAGIATSSKPHGAPGPDADTTALLAATGYLVLGMIVSVVAWVRIQTSQGRLLGRAWAITGTGVPAGLLLAGFAFAAIKMPRRAARPDAEAAGIRRTDLRPEEIAAAAARVVGGPPRMTDEAKANVVADIEAMWPKITPLMGLEPNSAKRGMALAPSERTRLVAMTLQEWNTARSWDYAGVLFPGPWSAELPSGRTVLLAPRLAWIVLDGDATHARVVRSHDTITLAYPVLFEDGAWHPALGAVEVEARPLADGDRSGWIGSRWFGEGRDPAERVTGGPPSLTPADRNKVARQLSAVLTIDQSGHTLEHFVPPPDGEPRSALRLYHVALDASGTTGSMVVSNGTQTIAVSVEKGRDSWRIADTGAESRGGAPVPEDRNGHLTH